MIDRRVALIIPGGLGTGKNNLGVPVLEQIVRLLSNEMKVTVFQLYKVNQDYQYEGFELLDFKAGNRVIQYSKFLYTFYKEHKKKRFTTVHGFWGWPCGFLAVVFGKVFNIKSIVSVLGGDAASIPEIGYGHLRNKFSRDMILWTLRTANEATALTHFLVKNLHDAGLTRELKIIPWGVDQGNFSFASKPLQKPIQFLHIANLNKIKDQETLLRAFKIIHETMPSYLTILGEGSEEEKIKQLIDQLRLNEFVTILKQLPYQQLPALYHQSDILLHTSLTEGQSEVVTEAMSCGVIVCGTNVGLLHDLPECCISVPVRAHEVLAKEVEKLIQDNDRMNTIRSKARTWCSAHSLKWTVKQMIGLYKA